MYFINKEFLDEILISKKAIEKASEMYIESPILFKSLVIFGAPGSGKSSVANYIAREACRYYGIENVNARYVKHGEIGFLIRFGLERKLVNILFIDNLTLVKVDQGALRSYFKIRHHQIFDHQKQGYVLSIIAIHRFHGCPVEVRTVMDGLVVLDSTMNPYDRTVLKQFVGEDVLKYMDEISSKKQENLELKSIAYYKSKSLEGWLKIPFVPERYIKYVME